MFEDLFLLGSYIPISTPISAYKLIADVLTPFGTIPAGDYFVKKDAGWTFVPATEFEAGFQPKP